MRQIEPTSPRLEDLLVIFVLIAVIWLVFSPVLNHDFINYDDPFYVTKNALVLDGISPEGMRWAMTAHTEGNWLPLTWLSHMLDVSLYGLQPGGHHLTSLLLHLANSLLVFIVFRQMTGSRWRSAFLAGLFALHPLHVEPVAWIAERKELLSSLFGLLAVGAYSRYVKRPHAGRYALVAVFFAMSLMSKPMWMTFPVLLLLLDAWPLNRFAPEGKVHVLRVRTLVVEKLPLFGLSLLSGLTALFTQHQIGMVQSLETFTLFERVGNALVSYVGYLGKTLWPLNLAVFYPHPGDGLDLWQPVAAAVFLAMVSAAVIRRFSRQPYLAVGWFWYLISLLPVIGLVQIGSQAVADRYTYLPLTGIFFAGIWGGYDALRRFHDGRLLLNAGSVLLIIVLAFAARGQLAYWKDSISLFERALVVTGPNPVALINLGEARYQRSEWVEAKNQYLRALEIHPGNLIALHQLALVLVELGNWKETDRIFHWLLEQRPYNPKLYYNFGLFLAKQGKDQEAIEAFDRAVKLRPDYPAAYNQMGLILMRRGNRPRACHFFDLALQMQGNFSLAQKNKESFCREP